MQGILYEESTIWLFLLVTVVMGGAASFLAGRAIAKVWQPWWVVALSALALGFAVRFLHHALFGGTMLSAQYYAVDTLFCLAFGSLGWRSRQALQMARQYGWLYEKAGPLAWRRRSVR